MENNKLKKIIENLKENQIESKGYQPYFSVYTEAFENNINSIEVLVETKNLSKEHLIQEGTWKSANYKDWMYRVDQEGYGSLKHIHVAKKKHISTKPQFSWDILGKRHDAHKFAATVPNAAKEIASNILSINIDLLEAVSIENDLIYLE